MQMSIDNRLVQVIVMIEDDSGYEVKHMEFSSYEEAKIYAEEEAKKAEEEYCTYVNYDTNVFATIENRYENWHGFIEIIDIF